MKLKIITTIFFLLITFAGSVFAQNTVRTKVGEPASSPGGTAPSAPEDIRQGIIDTFGITMNGFDQNHLLWTWERLWESGGSFTDNLRGTRIEATSGISSQVGCFGGETSLYLGQYQPKAFFKFIVLHELGHVFQACVPRSITRHAEQMNAYDQEGGISFYSQNATKCISGVSNYKEDYADMVAYYLDRSAGFGSGPASCGGPSNPPNPYENGYPIHLGVADSIFK